MISSVIAELSLVMMGVLWHLEGAAKVLVGLLVGMEGLGLTGNDFGPGVMGGRQRW